MGRPDRPIRRCRSCRTDDRSFVPTAAITPVVLELLVPEKDDDLEVHSPLTLAHTRDGCDVVAERRAVAPLHVARVVSPPVLDLAAGGDTQLEVAVRPRVVRHPVLALDHARRADDPRAEDRAGVPREVRLVPPEVLHLSLIHISEPTRLGMI